MNILISYNKFIKLQPFIIVFVDVSATAAAFVRTTVRQVSVWWTVVPMKAAAVAKMSTTTMHIKDEYKR